MPGIDIGTIIINIVICLFSIAFHEVAHGWVAFALGDSTAKREGRLTLNPLKHIDPIGTVLLPIMLILIKLPGFGWAKPVPVNPYNFKDQKYGSAKVAVAGPLANISLALVFGLALRFLPIIYTNGKLWTIFAYIIYINLVLAIFNLVPIPPLDGSHILFILLRKGADKFKMFLVRYGFFLLIFIIFFFFQYVSWIAYWFGYLIIGKSDWMNILFH
jgi:Zn-dependent protease